MNDRALLNKQLNNLDELIKFSYEFFIFVQNTLDTFPLNLNIYQDYNDGRSGFSYLNQVYLNTGVFNLNEIDYSKYNIINIIIHECLHCMQFTNYDYYNDERYILSIESDVEYETIMFLYNNSKLILDKFNIDVNCNHLNSLLNMYFKGYISTYERNTLEEFYINVLYNSLQLYGLNYKDYKKMVLNNSDIMIILDGVYYIIKQNNKFNENLLIFSDMFLYLYEYLNTRVLNMSNLREGKVIFEIITNNNYNDIDTLNKAFVKSNYDYILKFNPVIYTIEKSNIIKDWRK